VLDDAEALEAALKPLEAGLAGLPEVRVSELGAAAIRQGQAGEAVWAEDGLAWGDAAWASRDGRAVALGVWQGGRLKPTRVFPAEGAEAGA
jgi:tRNA pseudouridine55 synthase